MLDKTHDLISDINSQEVIAECSIAFEKLRGLPLDVKVSLINQIREMLHQVSPFSNEPVDFVKWIEASTVGANAYNPNSVAPPEMELLRLSIEADGYTQPIVANLEGDGYEVIDGFHRNRVGKECKEISERIHGYLPIVQIKQSQTNISDRMAATVRHNRARGKHQVDAMSDIVLALRRRNWSNEKIAKNLGMEPDEVLRLAQITGLIELFKDRSFSEAWEAPEAVSETVADE